MNQSNREFLSSSFNKGSQTIEEAGESARAMAGAMEAKGTLLHAPKRSLFETATYYMDKNTKGKYDVFCKEGNVLVGSYQFFGEAMSMTHYMTTYGTTKGMRVGT